VGQELAHYSKILEDQNRKIAEYTENISKFQEASKSSEYRENIAKLEKELEVASAAIGKTIVLKPKDVLSQKNYTTSGTIVKVREYNQGVAEGVVEAERYKREIVYLNANITRLQAYINEKSKLLPSVTKLQKEDEEGEASKTDAEAVDKVEEDNKEQKSRDEAAALELRKQIAELNRAKEESDKLVSELEKELNAISSNDVLSGGSDGNLDDLDRQLQDLEDGEKEILEKIKRSEAELRGTKEDIATKHAKLQSIEQDLVAAKKELQDTNEQLVNLENVQKELESALNTEDKTD